MKDCLFVFFTYFASISYHIIVFGFRASPTSETFLGSKVKGC